MLSNKANDDDLGKSRTQLSRGNLPDSINRDKSDNAEEQFSTPGNLL